MKKVVAILSVIIVLLLTVVVLFATGVIGGSGKSKNEEGNTITEKDDKENVTPEEKVTIKFDSNGGSKVESIEIKKGEKIVLPETTRDNYKFLGWYSKDVKADDNTTYEQDVTLTAKWEKIKEEVKEVTMKVNFESNGGTKLSPMTFKCTNNVATLKSLPKPKKDSYVFMSWEDKHGKSILDGAKLTCDGDITLFAVWEYDGPTANPEPDPEPIPVKEKTYKCPDGFKLEDKTKCVKLADPEKYCDEGWKEVNGECVNPKSPNTKGTRVCPSKTYDGWTGTGTYYEAGRGYCGYEELPSYTGSKQNCQNAHGTLAPNNHCYKHIEISYAVECESGEKLFAEQVIAPGNGGGCYQVKAMKKKCPSGYTSYSVYGECALIQNAVYE